MNLYYQGTDITRYVRMRSCVVRDSAGERCDSLKIEFDDAKSWIGWGPREDDEIRITHGGYDSGTLYLNTVLPENGVYTLLATALPCGARRKEYRSFTGKSLEEILRACGMASGMNYALFGVDGRITIPYIQQENEGCAAFLRRLLQAEGAELKCVNGKYTGIGILYAQDLTPSQCLELTPTTEKAEYRRGGNSLRALTVRTPYGSATATDEAVPSSHSRTVRNDLPVKDSAQAGRWARGLLLAENRNSESLTLETAFNIGFTAMTRIDITGNTDATGDWLVQEAEHDFINLTSRAVLRRCIRSIQ